MRRRIVIPNKSVLIVEDDAALRDALVDTLRANDISVVSADGGAEALAVLNSEEIGLVVSDVQMHPMSGPELLQAIRQRDASLPTILMTAYGTIEQAVQEMRSGAADYLVKPIEADALIEIVKRHLDVDVRTGDPIAADPWSRKLLATAKRVASTDATVTISGESGCGKEVIARYIHNYSNRSDKPFVAINCAAIPENMLEAVLFGYEKGAFTGASAAHPGKFEQAQGGTLLLDEISEMDVNLQAKLLRVIQEREVERIGARKSITLDVRVLATTNRNLRECVTKGVFREDLYYRLNVFPLHIPALRERPGDILPLAKFAIERHYDRSRPRPKLTADAKKALLAHSWPGNVRELENLIHRSLILLLEDTISASDLDIELTVGELEGDANSTAALHDNLKQQERHIIVEALNACHGNRSAAAQKLGISPRTLRYKVARLRKAGVVLPFVAAEPVTAGSTGG
jgi:two-component system response regulator FlrC